MRGIKMKYTYSDTISIMQALNSFSTGQSPRAIFKSPALVFFVALAHTNKSWELFYEN